MKEIPDEKFFLAEANSGEVSLQIKFRGITRNQLIEEKGRDFKESRKNCFQKKGMIYR